MLESQLSLLRAKYPDFEMVDASSSAKVAGCDALYIRGTFSVVPILQNSPVPLSILSRVFVVFSQRGTFSIGLSGSAVPGFFAESEFEKILSSIQIGA